MVLIIGGAYQGKLDYARTRYGEALSVFHCTEDNIQPDFSKDIINAFHWFALACTRAGTDAVTFVDTHNALLREKIIVMDDITCGVVPMGAENRLWREQAGRSMTRLAVHADEVTRVFCGMGVRIK